MAESKAPEPRIVHTYRGKPDVAKRVFLEHAKTMAQKGYAPSPNNTSKEAMAVEPSFLPFCFVSSLSEFWFSYI